MVIIRQEKTIIPRTKQGIKLADYYEKKMVKQRCFDGRKESEDFIVLYQSHSYDIGGDEEDENKNDRNNH